jgi:hypothetical protein
MMILTGTPKTMMISKTMKRVVHRVAARAPFQRKTTLSVLHHMLFLSLSSFTLSLALNRNNNNQPMSKVQQSERKNATPVYLGYHIKP